MNTFSKTVGLVAAIFMMVGFIYSEAYAEKKVGIVIWTDEGRYVESKKGIMDQLKKDGFGEPAVRFLQENAGGNKAKAVDIAQKFHAAKVDMVIAVGTSAAVPVAKEFKDVPVIFSMVYDPVESKIAQDWKSSGNNTTGSSSRVPMTKLMGELKQLKAVKKLGVLYTPGEKNSEAQLKEIQSAQNEFQVKVVPVPLTKKEEVGSMMSEVTGAVDAMYITGSSIVGDTLPAIVDAANKAKVVTVTHLEDLVEKGVLLGVCADSYAVGVLAGEKAAKVLKGANPSSVPIDMLKKPDVILNAKSAKAGQFQISAEFRKTVTKTIE